MLLPQCFTMLEAQAHEIGKLQQQLATLTDQLHAAATTELVERKVTG